MNSRIKKVRKYHKLSQAAFAESLGTSRNAIANLENGRTEANGTLQELICIKYHINKNWLVTGTGNMYSNDNPNEQINEQILRIYANLPSDHKKIVRDFIASMLANMPPEADENPDYDEYTLGDIEDLQAEEKKRISDAG